MVIKRLLFTVSVGINGESKRNSAEARQCGDGGGVRVVHRNQIHQAPAHVAAVVAGIRQVVQARHRHAAGGSWNGVGRPVCNEARAGGDQRRHGGAVGGGNSQESRKENRRRSDCKSCGGIADSHHFAQFIAHYSMFLTYVFPFSLEMKGLDWME